MSNIYITGDTHGSFERIEYFCDRVNTSKNDVMIVLGDAGLNYFLDGRDVALKKYVNSLPITFCLLRGNHEARPGTGWDIENKGAWIIGGGTPVSGRFMMQEEFPSIRYMLDGETYGLHIGAKTYKALAIGGAYSVDKDYRLEMYDLGNRNYRWFYDEQLSEEEMNGIRRKISGKHFDYVFTHTCPYSDQPTDLFMSGIDQKTVDKSMEIFLQDVKENLITYRSWYCGHWHTDRDTKDISFLFNSVKMLGSAGSY